VTTTHLSISSFKEQELLNVKKRAVKDTIKLLLFTEPMHDFWYSFLFCYSSLTTVTFMEKDNTDEVN